MPSKFTKQVRDGDGDAEAAGLLECDGAADVFGLTVRVCVGSAAAVGAGGTWTSITDVARAVA